ncbi:hypothetical protein C1645_824468 [Glomus cerebriforme]|uniref:Uncharacterized protein n=1 Tax=Glomus cerebriforme TaxID=658196 RepID=A0A397SVJ7_9GLOM|nr:hypothetical protein C1645_824468 [Glomus cerebriforme]
MGCNLASDLKKTCKGFQDFQALESPNSLNEYQLVLPKSIYFLFEGMVIKIWLPTILSSFCQKPHLLSSLHQVLQSVNVVAHTGHHERHLEYKRMSAANPTRVPI